MSLDVDRILSGPRGRGLCLAFADEASRSDGYTKEPIHPFAVALFAASWADGQAVYLKPRLPLFPWGAKEPRPPSASEIGELLLDVRLPPVADDALVRCLAQTVASAMYWQEPDSVDRVAALPEMRPGLERVAHHLASAPKAAWMTEPLAADQHLVVLEPSVDFSGPADRLLADWRVEILRDEERSIRERPTDPTANWSGNWWSHPPHGLPVTAPLLPNGQPGGLWLVEDELGWETATSQRARVPEAANVYEVDGAEAWAELCRMASLPVTASRRHDWYRTTGRNGRWVIPDWTRLPYDSIHLTVAGYLEAATRTIEVDEDTASVLAGWAPGDTHWLTDLELEGPVTRWTKDLETDEWVEVTRS